MPQQVNITNQQTMEVVVSGPDGANRLFITTGIANGNLSVSDNTASGTGITQRQTFTALLEPALTAGQFRRAIATASLANVSYTDNDPAQRDSAQWRIEEAEADFDDESGKVELRFALEVRSRGVGSNARISAVAFQVTKLAAMD